MDPYLFSQGMVIQVSGIATSAEGTDDVPGIDTKDIDLWDSPGYRSPNILLPVAYDVVEIATNTRGTIVGRDVLAHSFGWKSFDLFGTIGGINGDTIFSKHPHVCIETTDRNIVHTDLDVTGSYEIP